MVVLSRLCRVTTLSLSSVPGSTRAYLLQLVLLLNSLCLHCVCCFFKVIHLKAEEETDGSVSNCVVGVFGINCLLYTTLQSRFL